MNEQVEAWEGQPAWEWAEQATRLPLARRTATHWWEASGVEARTLLKLYGIRFDVIVTGQVGGPGGMGRVGVEGGNYHGLTDSAQVSLRQGSLGSSPRPSLWAPEQLGWAW